MALLPEILTSPSEIMIASLDYPLPLGMSDCSCLLLFDVLCYVDNDDKVARLEYNSANYTRMKDLMKQIEWENEMEGKKEEKSWTCQEQILEYIK